jgi:hypothetical protein
MSAPSLPVDLGVTAHVHLTKVAGDCQFIASVQPFQVRVPAGVLINVAIEKDEQHAPRSTHCRLLIR